MIDNFIKELERQGRSANTIQAYKRDLELFEKWFNKTHDNKLDKIFNADVKKYVEYLLCVSKLTVSSINRKLTVIKRYNDYLESLYGKNEVEIKLIKKFNSCINRKIINNKDLKKLRDAFYQRNNKRDIAIFEILINTGLRESELISLELDNIVVAEKNGTDDYLRLNLMISNKYNMCKEIQLNGITQKAVNNYLKIRPITSNNKLFIGQRGSITRTTLNKILKQYCINAGIEVISPRVLRYTWLSKCNLLKT
ncbi:integrase [Clostridium fermenticellae]|uniref:Integrase n=1 Tax=Clostridium fermenticellae TaxID=2068654 RepID=A0A386H1J9_9CLOT|nr:site-specific integrase [Clostridium fermenticellae]AYD39581.1 integrase [Clostridium fermenticellae]